MSRSAEPALRSPFIEVHGPARLQSRCARGAITDVGEGIEALGDDVARAMLATPISALLHSVEGCGNLVANECLVLEQRRVKLLVEGVCAHVSEM
jgi:hypothetical protein